MVQLSCQERFFATHDEHDARALAAVRWICEPHCFVRNQFGLLAHTDLNARRNFARIGEKRRFAQGRL